MLTHARLKSILSYDKATGVFRWLVSVSHIKAGAIAGSADTTRLGRKRIQIDGKFYETARLAWFYETGKWPVARIDHKDRDASNDIFSNLRPATSSQNNINRLPFAKSGLKGVYRCIRNNKVKFEVYIRKPRTYLGQFSSPLQAAWVYDTYAIERYGEFAVLNFMRNP